MAHAEKGVRHVPMSVGRKGLVLLGKGNPGLFVFERPKVGKKRHNGYGPHTYRKGWPRMEDVTLIGLDLGTQGVRAIASTPTGEVLASASEPYEAINAVVDPLKEQDPAHWRAAVLTVLTRLAEGLPASASAGRVLLCVDGTSGTIVALDEEMRPLRNAIMYNDSRAKELVVEVHERTADLEEKLGYRMGASYALPKMVWIRRNEPEVFERTRLFSHQTDFIVGTLTGEYRVSDYSNALKSGYDLVDDEWPSEVLRAVGIEPELLPVVVRPGQPIARILSSVADQTGLPANTTVVAGSTDGYASCIASGVVAPGQFNSTIGTTLVMKGVSKGFIRDAAGRVYCHKHPEGYWYPGGAGNVGGLCLNLWFGKENFDRLNELVPGVTPTGNIVYPLTTTGERFPFVRPDAEKFEIIRKDDEASRYAGTMEGVGYYERLCFDTLAALGCEVGDEITIAGGAAKAPVWSQIRANILGKRLMEPRIVEAAFGSAIVAGTVALDRTLTASAREMVRYERMFEPDPVAHAAYDKLYEEFKSECVERGYIDGNL